jgi:hypothetical protein
LSLLLALGWWTVVEFIARRQGRKVLSFTVASLLLLLVLSPAAAGIRELARLRTSPSAELIEVLEWLREEKSPPGREGVLSDWDFGYYIEYFAKKPVLINPSGTELGIQPMRDAANFFLAQKYSVAEEVLKRRRIGFIILRNPVVYYSLMGFIASDTEQIGKTASEEIHGTPVRTFPQLETLLVTHLYFNDGITISSHEANAKVIFRLLYESPSIIRVRLQLSGCANG